MLFSYSTSNGLRHYPSNNLLSILSAPISIGPITKSYWFYHLNICPHNTSLSLSPFPSSTTNHHQLNIGFFTISWLHGAERGAAERRYPMSKVRKTSVRWQALGESFRGQTDWNHNHRKVTNLITWTTALSNSMKLWGMLCRASQDGRVMVERSDRMWSTGEGNGKPLQYSCLENPMNSMKRQKDRTLKDALPRSVAAQHATGDQWRNNSRNKEGMEPKQKHYPAVDVAGDRSKVRYCKEQYCIGTWNVGPWIKANWEWSNKRWQEWMLTF